MKVEIDISEIEDVQMTDCQQAAAFTFSGETAKTLWNAWLCSGFKGEIHELEQDQQQNGDTAFSEW